MSKSLPKRPENQSNLITRIHCQVKVKRTKKLQQQSTQKMETTEVNAIMEKLEKSDGNGYRSKNNINHFTPIYESDYEEVTKHRKKHKTPIIVPIKEYKVRKK